MQNLGKLATNLPASVLPSNANNNAVKGASPEPRSDEEESLDGDTVVDSRSSSSVLASAGSSNRTTPSGTGGSGLTTGHSNHAEETTPLKRKRLSQGGTTATPTPVMAPPQGSRSGMGNASMGRFAMPSHLRRAFQLSSSTSVSPPATTLAAGSGADTDTDENSSVTSPTLASAPIIKNLASLLRMQQQQHQQLAPEVDSQVQGCTGEKVEQQQEEDEIVQSTGESTWGGNEAAEMEEEIREASVGAVDPEDVALTPEQEALMAEYLASQAMDQQHTNQPELEQQQVMNRCVEDDDKNATEHALDLRSKMAEALNAMQLTTNRLMELLSAHETRVMQLQVHASQEYATAEQQVSEAKTKQASAVNALQQVLSDCQ